MTSKKKRNSWTLDRTIPVRICEAEWLNILTAAGKMSQRLKKYVSGAEFIRVAASEKMAREKEGKCNKL